MHFKTLPADVVLRAIEGYPNELREEQQRLDALYARARCPTCKGKNLSRFLPANEPFSKTADTFLPRHLLRCSDCGVEFDVHSQLIVTPSAPAGWSPR